MTTPRLVGGRYEVVALIGRGGMADVHRAHDTVLGRDVALKVLRGVADVDRERFAGEARVLAALDHEAVVTLYDAGVDDDRPWLALELVEGRPLSILLADGPIATATAARVGADVASALAHAHERGVVHRDVKPANVLLTPAGRARLADFGIARLVGEGAALTMTGHTIGTAAYLAPEQVRGEATTGAADVYALGLVLLEALTGRRGYDGPPVEAALARLHHGPLVPTSLPRGWAALVVAMTAAAAAERPSAADAAVRLRELSREHDDPTAVLTPAGRATPAGEATSAVPVAPVAPVAHAAPVGGRPTPGVARRRAVPLAVAATALVVLGATAVVSRGGGDPSAAGAATAPPTSTSGAALSGSTAAGSPTARASSATPVTTAPVTPASTAERGGPPVPGTKPVKRKDAKPKPGKGKGRAHAGEGKGGKGGKGHGGKGKGKSKGGRGKGRG